MDLPYRWRRETYAPIDDWTADSPAFTTGLAAIEAVVQVISFQDGGEPVT